jgi:hypothetical protein
MDDKICSAIAQVMANLPKLNKGETNKHGGYSFASVDDFFEAVQPQMAKAGLVVTSDEQDFEVIGDGKDAWLKMRFAFVAHAGGAEYGPLNRTAMVRASMGSQALGAAQSYAEKQFLRSLFKMATGEGAGIDADSHPAADLPQQRSNGTRQMPERLKGPIKTRAAARTRYGEIVRELHACEDEDTLEAFLWSIKPELEQYETELPSAWNGDGADFLGLAKEIQNIRDIVTGKIQEAAE